MSLISIRVAIRVKPLTLVEFTDWIQALLLKPELSEADLLAFAHGEREGQQVRYHRQV